MQVEISNTGDTRIGDTSRNPRLNLTSCACPKVSQNTEVGVLQNLKVRQRDAGKAKCKAALQEELGLRVDPKVPLLGYIGRLDWQKGPDCALDAVQGLAQRGCQTIMLGSGVPEYEQRMRQSEQSFPDSFR